MKKNFNILRKTTIVFIVVILATNLRECNVQAQEAATDAQSISDGIHPVASLNDRATIHRKEGRVVCVQATGLVDRDVITVAELNWVDTRTMWNEVGEDYQHLGPALVVSNSKLTDAGIQCITSMKHLRFLHLNKATQMNDQTLVRLADLAHLERLELFDGEISDRALSHLGRMNNLEHINFSQQQITDAGLAYLAMQGQDKFTAILLSGNSGITDKGVNTIKKMSPNLKQLKLARTAITDEALSDIAELPELMHLGISGNKITDTGLAHLQQLRRLVILQMNETQVTNEGLAHLTHLSALRLLQLFNTSIDDSGMPHLSDLHELEQLDLGGTKVSGPGLRHLSGLHNLRVLILENTKVSGPGLESLEGLKKLNVLGLEGTAVSDATLHHLRTLSNVGYINLRNTKVTKKGLDQIRTWLPKCTIEF